MAICRRGQGWRRAPLDGNPSGEAQRPPIPLPQSGIPWPPGQLGAAAAPLHPPHSRGPSLGAEQLATDAASDSGRDDDDDDDDDADDAADDAADAAADC